MKVGKT